MVEHTRAESGAPLRAYPMAGVITSRSSMVPQSRSNNIIVPNALGVTAGSNPAPGTKSNPMVRNRADVAAAGATPWPLSTDTLSAALS